jgi:uncharacterized protein DUF4349
MKQLSTGGQLMWWWKNHGFAKGIALGASLILVAVVVFSLSIPNLLVMHKRVAKVSDFDRLPSSHYDRVAGGGGGGGGGDAAKLRLAPQIVYAAGTKIVRTAQLDLLVDDVSESRQKITSLVASEGGYIQSERVEGDMAKLSLKVPTTRFEEVRERLRKLAKRVREDASTATDVSKQYIDTDARLRNFRAEELQFLDILKHARTVADTLAATKELSEVRENIEETDAELQHLKDQIDMSAIDVTISAEAIESYAVHWSMGSSLKSAWKSSLQGLADFVDFILWLILSLPVLVLWLVTIYVLAMLAWLLLKRVVVPVWRRIFSHAVVVAPPPSS